MNKGKESSPADTEGAEEYSVEKVLDRRVNKGKVCKSRSIVIILIRVCLTVYLITRCA